MQQVYRKVQELGKPIIVVSDMYWPKEYLIKILNNVGYDGWEEIFVSCEQDATKHAGLLQEIAWEAIGKDHSVVHFGDHYENDVKGSIIMGWDAVWYQNCRDKTNFFDIQDDFTIPGSIRAAICSNHLNNGAGYFSKEYEHGFLFGGIMVCGYCEYINKVAGQMNADAIWFLARDMDVFQRLYGDYYYKYENEYVYASRAAMRHLNIQEYPSDFYQRYLKAYSLSGHLSISQVLKESQLGVLDKYLYECGLNDDMPFDTTAYDDIFMIYMNHIDEIAESFADEIEGAKEYFRGLLKDHKKICVADLGWNGTIMVELDRFFKKHFPDVELQFTLFGVTKTQTTTDLQTGGKMHSYAFSKLHDQGLEIDPGSIRGNTSIMCLEAMFSANSPSLAFFSMDSKGKHILNFGIKTEPEWMVEEVQNGIMTFASMYCELGSKLNRQIHVSPEDAFRPYNSISEDYQYLYLLFNHVKEYEDGSVVSGSTKRLSTIGNIMQKRNHLS